MERRQLFTDKRATNSSSPRPDSWESKVSIAIDSAVHKDRESTLTLATSFDEVESHHTMQSLSPISTNFAARIERLAQGAWTLEQNDGISDVRRYKIEQELKVLETLVETVQLTESETTPAHPGSNSANPSPLQNLSNLTASTEKNLASHTDLLGIHEELATVVTDMRLRQQEQRHLHQLTATKLEAVAQRCLFQEQQMEDLVRMVQSLRQENQILGQENDRLRDNIVGLESEASRREVAVTAMTSAVAGLEGWIDDADNSRERYEEVEVLTPKDQQRRTVARGKGRFRGRYYIDESQKPRSPSRSNARDLQDGVKAWIRGFKDVEDACVSLSSERAKEL